METYTMKKLEIFDPPMCCKSGICGSSADPTLVNFASDLEWLKKQGVTVVRYGLSLEPEKFLNNDSVKNTIQTDGNSCLPLIIMDNVIASKAKYPSREKLAEICKIEYNDDEAPPIHREENCCCGVDCDCHSIKMPEQESSQNCNCTNAPAEDNCICSQPADDVPEVKNKNFTNILLVIMLILLLLLIID